MKQLSDKANLAVRRCQTDSSTITVEHVRSSDYRENIFKNDEGYYLTIT